MQRLKDLRKNKGLYQKDVASYLGIERTTYVKWETGKSQPDPLMLKKLATFFNVSVDYILGLTDTKSVSGSKPNDEDERLTEFKALYEELSEEQRKLIISQMKWLLNDQE